MEVSVGGYGVAVLVEAVTGQRAEDVSFGGAVSDIFKCAVDFLVFTIGSLKEKFKVSLLNLERT